MAIGWIQLHRRLLENKLWLSEPFTKGQTQVDLLLLASHKDTIFWKRGIEVKQARGTVGVSEIGLSDRWKWSRGKTRRFLNWLENEQQIVQQKSRVTTLIKITNYDNYQADGTTDSTTNGQQTDTINNVKNVNNNKKKEVTKVTKKENGFYPEWLDKELWREFKKMRVAIKKPLTEFAEKKSITKLKTIIDKGFSQEDVVSIAIEKCWQTFYEPHEKLMQKDDESAFDKELSAIRKQRELANEKKTALSK